MWRKSDSHRKCLGERANWNKQTLRCSLMKVECTSSIWIMCCSLMQPELWQRRNRWRMPKGSKIVWSLSTPTDRAATTQYVCWSWRPRNSLQRKKPRLQRYGEGKLWEAIWTPNFAAATCSCSLPVWFYCLIMVMRWHKNLSRTQ